MEETPWSETRTSLTEQQRKFWEKLTILAEEKIQKPDLTDRDILDIYYLVKNYFGSLGFSITTAIWYLGVQKKQNLKRRQSEVIDLDEKRNNRNQTKGS